MTSPTSPAVPINPNGQIHASDGGLTIRAHFASMAMHGILSHGQHYEMPITTAEYAIECADALIKELNKDTK